MSQPPPDSSDRDSHFEAVLAEILRLAETGQQVDPRQFVNAYPHLADELRSFFRAREMVSRLAQPFFESSESTIGLRSTPSSDEPRRVRYFGDYELLDELGRGGMGVVYKARQLSLNRAVALKMILAGNLASPVDVQRFHIEAEAAANLDHPHIVPIYEIGTHEEQHYFSMKLVEGRSLREALPSLRANLREGVKVLAQVARAVHHAHQRGMLHRDLKPANILLDANLQPYVTDFGLAKHLQGGSDMTRTGAIVGTPTYMAPEQARGQSQLSTAVDVYSLGTILYELLTGSPPFHGATPMDTLLEVMSREPPRPSTLASRIDRDLETIALRSLEKDPAARYHSAAALADDLDRWLAGEPILARASTPTERLVKWVRRHPTRAGLGAALAVALLALLGLAVSTAYQARLQRSYRDAVAARADADQQRARAQRSELRIQEILYAADVSLAQSRWERTDLARMRPLLARHAPGTGGPDLRGFEWNYLWHLANRERLTLRGHQQTVTSLVLTADGQTLFSGDRSSGFTRPGEVRRWNLKHPQESTVIWTQTVDEKTPSFFAGVDALAIAPNGDMLAVSDHRSIRLLSTDNGKQLRVLTGHNDSLQTLAFSADGQTLASGAWNGEIKLWDPATGDQRATLADTSKGLSALAFSPDGKSLVAGGYNRDRGDSNLLPGGLTLWEVATAQPLGDFANVRSRPTCVAFSPDGKSVVAGSTEGIVTEWDLGTREVSRFHRGHTADVSAVQFSRDSKQIISASYDATIRFALATIGDPLAVYKGHEAEVHAMTLSPDGATLASGDRDGMIRIWNLQADPQRTVLRNQPWAMNTLACLPDNQTLLVVDYKGARFYDLKNSRLKQSLAFDHWVFGAALAPDGQLLATGGNRGDGGDGPGVVKLWNLPAGTLRTTLDPHVPSVKDLAFSPDGTLLVARGWETEGPRQVVTAWHVADGREAGTWTKAVHAAFSSDSRTLALAGPRGVRLWNRDNGLTRDFGAASAGGAAVSAFAPRAPLLAVARDSASVELWDLKSGVRRWQTQPSDGAASGLLFAPDESTLAVVGPRTTRLLDVAGGRLNERLPIAAGAIAFTPDSRTLATTSSGEVQLWQASTGQHLLDLGTYGVNKSEIRCIIVSPDQRIIAVAGGYRDENDGIHLFQAPRLKE